MINDARPASPDVSPFPSVARWISAPAELDPEGDQHSASGVQRRLRAPVLFNDLRIDRPVRSAVLYACGLGLHHITIDGDPINDHRLDPPFTDYNHRVQYVTTDVTDQLAVGDHRLSITLGRGFFALPTENVWHWQRAPWRGPLRALAELQLHYDDGSSEVIGTDTDWLATLDRITYDCYYAGEAYDATLSIPEPVAAIGIEAPAGALEPTRHEPIRVTWSGTPTWTRVGEVWVADFGRTIAGWVGLRTDQAAGAEVKIIYAEELEPDGTLAPKSVHVTGPRFQTDSYVGNGEHDQQWQPLFTYKGFRYVQLEGLTHPPTEQTLTAYAAHNDVPRVGDFSCSEPLFEKFVAAMARTIENNLHHIPTDTPVYEKNGWTGDAQVGAISMLSLFDLQRLLTKWVIDIRDAQTPEGALPVIVPTAGWGYNDLAPSPEWTTVYPHLLRELYRRYGDRDLVADHWPALTRYLDWELGKLVDGVCVSELGDYLAPGTQGNGPDDSGVTASAFLIRALRDSAELAVLLGNDHDRDRFRAAADDLTAAMNDRYLDRDRGQYVVGPVYSQTSNSVALLLGLVPEDAIAPVVANLVADIEARDDHHQVGCIGANTLLPALTRYGHGELALRVARQTTFPSWGFWISQGADTMWEYWEAKGRSHDHYFHGTVVQWLFESVAGLRCGDHGWSEFAVAPQPLGDLTHAAYAIDTVRGRASVSWHRDHDQLRLTVDVPEGSTASVTVPGTDARSLDDTTAAVDGAGQHYRVGPGTATFTAQLG